MRRYQDGAQEIKAVPQELQPTAKAINGRFDAFLTVFVSLAVCRRQSGHSLRLAHVSINKIDRMKLIVFAPKKKKERNHATQEKTIRLQARRLKIKFIP